MDQILVTAAIPSETFDLLDMSSGLPEMPVRTRVASRLIAPVQASGVGQLLDIPVEILPPDKAHSAIKFISSDPAQTVALIESLLAGTPEQDLVVVTSLDPGYAQPEDTEYEGDQTTPALEGPYKSIEIYYDQAVIPPEFEHPLDFRNAAMDLIEHALMAARAGEWVGAEIGANLVTGTPEVNFGFQVSDFDRAEQIVRDTVKGTPFDRIREITRYTESDTD